LVCRTYLSIREKNGTGKNEKERGREEEPRETGEKYAHDYLPGMIGFLFESSFSMRE